MVMTSISAGTESLAPIGPTQEPQIYTATPAAFVNFTISTGSDVRPALLKFSSIVLACFCSNGGELELPVSERSQSFLAEKDCCIYPQPLEVNGSGQTAHDPVQGSFGA